MTLYPNLTLECSLILSIPKNVFFDRMATFLPVCNHDLPICFKRFSLKCVFTTGVEKFELLAKQAGNDDPFYMKAFSRGKVILISFILF